MALSEQVSVRLTPELRQFIEAELEEVHGIDPRVRATAATIIRAHLEVARQRKRTNAQKERRGGSQQ